MQTRRKKCSEKIQNLAIMLQENKHAMRILAYVFNFKIADCIKVIKVELLQQIA
jgi:hypothetical protein